MTQPDIDTESNAAVAEPEAPVAEKAEKPRRAPRKKVEAKAEEEPAAEESVEVGGLADLAAGEPPAATPETAAVPPPAPPAENGSRERRGDYRQQSQPAAETVDIRVLKE